MQLGTSVIPVAGPASIKVQHPSSLQLHKEHRERQLFPPHSHLLLRWSQTFIPQEKRRNNSGSGRGRQPECVWWSVWRLCAELWYVSVPVCESECMFSYTLLWVWTQLPGAFMVHAPSVAIGTCSCNTIWWQTFSLRSVQAAFRPQFMYRKQWGGGGGSNNFWQMGEGGVWCGRLNAAVPILEIGIALELLANRPFISK